MAARGLASAILTDYYNGSASNTDVESNYRTDVKFARTSEKTSKDTGGRCIAARLLLVDLADLAAIVASRWWLLAGHGRRGDNGRGGEDSDSRGELHIDWLRVVGDEINECI